MRSNYSFISKKGNIIMFSGLWEYGLSGKPDDKNAVRRPIYKQSYLTITVNGKVTATTFGTFRLRKPKLNEPQDVYAVIDGTNFGFLRQKDAIDFAKWRSRLIESEMKEAYNSLHRGYGLIRKLCKALHLGTTR